jgi:hypothetical protein
MYVGSRRRSIDTNKLESSNALLGGFLTNLPLHLGRAMGSRGVCRHRHMKVGGFVRYRETYPKTIIALNGFHTIDNSAGTLHTQADTEEEVLAAFDTGCRA